MVQVMVQARRISMALVLSWSLHKKWVGLTNTHFTKKIELSYLVKQNIKTLHTEKERYTEDLLHTYTTYVSTYLCYSEQHCLSLASISEALLGRLELP